MHLFVTTLVGFPGMLGSEDHLPTWQRVHGAHLVPGMGTLMLALDKKRKPHPPSPWPRTSPRAHLAHGCEVGWAPPTPSVQALGALGVPAPRALVRTQAHFPECCGLVPGEELTPRGLQCPLARRLQECGLPSRSLSFLICQMEIVRLGGIIF